MGEFRIQIHILRNRKPVLLSWLNTDNSIIEGCLVTCPCQGYKLKEGNADESMFALKLSQAMEQAELVSFYQDVNLTGLVRGDLDVDVERENDVVTPKKRRKRRKHTAGKLKKLKNVELNGEEDVEQVAAKDKVKEEHSEGVDKLPVTEDDNTDDETDTDKNREILADDDVEDGDDDDDECASVRDGGALYEKETGMLTLAVDEDSPTDKLAGTVAGEQNVGNTVEVGEDYQTKENLDVAGESPPSNPKTATRDDGASIESSFLASSLGLPANSTVTLTDVEGNTYLNVQGVGVLEATNHAAVVSGAAGANYITMLSNAQQNTLSAEQEQALLKTLEGFISATSGEDGVLRPESLQVMADATTPGPPEADRYTVKVIQGEAQGPLKKKDQARMDKYREFKNHKDSEFHRKYHKYQNMKGVNFVLCEVCGAPLNNKNMKHHMAALHQAPEERPRNFVCSICGRAFLCSSNLQRHMDTHSGVRYKCRYCSKSYSQDHSRKLHEKGHFGEIKRTLRNPFAGLDDVENANSEDRSMAFLYCELCYKRLRPQSLRGHMSIHRNEYFTCSVCQKVLRISGKREHMLRHTSEKKFVCSICPKRFISKGSLEAHIRVHTQERPYKCKYCSETFKTSHTRNTHQRIHTGEKPYSCSKCHKSWRDRTTYWGHMKKHHPGEPLMYIRKSLQIQAARDAEKHKGNSEASESTPQEHVHSEGMQDQGHIAFEEVIQVEGVEGTQGEGELPNQVTTGGSMEAEGVLQTPTVIQLQEGMQLQQGMHVNAGIQVQGSIQNPAVIQLPSGIPIHTGLQTQGSVQVQNIIQVEGAVQAQSSLQAEGVKVEEEVPDIISLTVVSPTMDV